MWERVDGDTAERLLARLVKEVGPNHLLHGRLGDLPVVARRTGQDDISVTDRTVNGKAYIVHLVFGEQTPDRDPAFPSTAAIGEEEIEQILGAAAPC